jgi:CHAD domain-containing protein
MSQPMRDYAREQTATLLDRLAYQVNRAAKLGDAAAVDDLRVAMRRFLHCLRAFRQFFPKDRARKIRRQLRAALRQAGAVRDRDAALTVLAASGISARAQLPAALRQQREDAEKVLIASLRAWRHRGFSRKWRDALEL